MKKFKFLFLVMLLMIIPFISIKASDNYFTANDKVTIKKNVNHSYFAAGNKLSNEAVVDGILFMAGNSIKSKEIVEYGMFAGNTIDITADVNKDLFVVGNNIEIENNTLKRDAFIAGNSVTISSNIDGNLFVSSTDMELYDVVIKGNVNLNCDRIVFGENVQIEGILKYNEDAQVKGLDDITVSEVKTYEENEKKVDLKENIKIKSFSTISLMIVCIILVAIFPSIYKKLSKEVSAKKISINILVGLGTLIIVPIAAIIVLLTVIGIPISILSLLLYAVFIYLSIGASAIVIGNNILTKVIKKEDNQYFSILIGILIVKIVTCIPVLGGVMYFLLMLWGLGLILELFKKNKVK